MARENGSRASRRDAVDRSGDPDEELAPVEQARVLGIGADAIRRYRKHPPAGWPSPVRVETLPAGGVREFRTRRQLWAYADSDPASRAGKAGRKPAAVPDPRIALAREALRDGRGAGTAAAYLADRHGGGLSTWKRIVTAARKET
ncbi:hypothetical protein [Streptomyces sp. NPDC088925]|uniref:hypothetical protein n=1 Tax=Streptomyces sp. NPDC088925 TaxID=3365914 RepID=UPI0037FF060E